MKKVIVLLIILCLTLSVVVFATEIESNINKETNSSGEEKKAEIYLRPEDAHPNGVNMEIGTASFWLEVGARVSGDSGETVSYQWYESVDGNMEHLKALEGETNTIFIPEQKIGTTYYCVGVITNVNGKSTTEYTKLLEATFTPKMIDQIWIVGVKEPVIGEKITLDANQYTDYELNDYYGYEITNVTWTPNDKEFKEGQEYTINIEIEYWDNVEIMKDLDVKVNDLTATIKNTPDGKGANISYTFEKLEKNVQNEKSESGEDKNANLGEEYSTNGNQTENEDNTKLELATIVLVTIFVILLVFSLMLIIKRK